jgi:PAS domain S-box-containing protein
MTIPAVAGNAPEARVEVLIVEDSPTQAQHLQHILEREGYDVTVAGNGRVALERLRQAPPTLVISDIVMPEMGGYELCRLIKADPDLGRIPVFLVTDLTDPQDVIRGLECSADNFILKPYDERYLLGRVKFALLNRELRNTDRAGMGVEIVFNGQQHYIAADRLQILNLLLSTYDAAIQRNAALDSAREEMRSANRTLTELNGRLAHESRERRQAEQRLRSILDNMNAFVGETTPDGMLCEANNLILKAGGAWRDELIGKPLYDTWSFSYSTEIREQIRADIARAATGVMVRHDLMLRLANGSMAPVDFMLVPVCDDSGQVVKLIPSAIDIAARKQAEQVAEQLNRDLERSNAALAARGLEIRSILDNVLDCIVTTDGEGIIRSANPALARIFGFTPDEVIGRPVTVLLPALDEGTPQDDAEYCARNSGQTVPGRHKNGDAIAIDQAVTEYRLNQERLFLWTLHDCRERERSERQLRESREELSRFKETLDQALDCIFLFDPQTLRFVYANRGAQLLVGYTEHELLRMTPLDLKTPQSESEFRHDLVRLISGETPSLLYESVHHHKDGHPIQVEVLTQLVEQSGKPSLFVKVVRDISERKRAEARLLEAKDEAVRANLAKDTFLATMSHEIRTPLNGLLGMLELLAYTRLDAGQQQTLDAARDSGKGLVRIIDDVLDHAKIEAGKLALLPEAVAIAQLFDRVLGNFAAVAQSKSLSLSASVDEAIAPYLLADPLRVRQILANFVSNSVKFSEHGAIELRAELLVDDGVTQTLRLSVSDHGIGISDEAQTRLFHAFEQAGAETARLYGGTGLGLAICRRLVELMDGEIAVRSELGRGTVMSVQLSLPRAEPPPVAPPPADDPLPHVPAPAGIGRVLAVDDNSTNRLLLASQLHMLGVAVSTVASAPAALAQWRDGGFDVLITDCNMPGMDGYALSRAIRDVEAAEGREATWIVAWTANVPGDTVDRCRDAGMNDFLSKPAELAELAATLARKPARPDAALDRAVLDALVGGNVAAATALLRDFQMQLGADGTQLREACARGDVAAAAATAHKLKSSSRAVGAMALSAVCLRMEQAGHAGELDTLRLAEREFASAMAAVDTCLIKLLETPRSAP